MKEEYTQKQNGQEMQVVARPTNFCRNCWDKLDKKGKPMRGVYAGINCIFIGKSKKKEFQFRKAVCLKCGAIKLYEIDGKEYVGIYRNDKGKNDLGFWLWPELARNGITPQVFQDWVLEHPFQKTLDANVDFRKHKDIPNIDAVKKTVSAYKKYYTNHSPF